MADGRHPNPPTVTGLTVSDGVNPPGAPAGFTDGQLNGNFGVPRMEGTGIPGDGITVRSGDGRQWDCMVDSDGTWHVELGELDNGQIDFEVLAQDIKSGNLSDSTDVGLSNETSNEDRAWQRAGAADRIKKEGSQSYGPQEPKPTPTPTGAGGGGGGGQKPDDAGGGDKPPEGSGQGGGPMVEPVDPKQEGGSGTGVTPGGAPGSGGTGFEKGNAPPALTPLPTGTQTRAR